MRFPVYWFWLSFYLNFYELSFFQIFWLVIYLKFHQNFTHKGLSDVGHSPTRAQRNPKGASFYSFGFWGSLFWFSIAYFDAFFTLRMTGLWLLEIYSSAVNLCWISMVLCFWWEFYLLFSSVISRFAGYFWCFIGINKFTIHQFVERNCSWKIVGSEDLGLGIKLNLKVSCTFIV